MTCPVRIYLQTDPVHDQVRVMEGDASTIANLAAHTHHFTYGVNIGAPDCPVPSEKFDWRPTFPPVVMDLWPPRPGVDGSPFTTVATWRNAGKDLRIGGESYRWSKHENFLALIDLPRRVASPIELALENIDDATIATLTARGWRVTGAFDKSVDADTYQAHVYGSRGEFTVAKDLVARTRSGWFSDRSVCYLAAGRPVVTQETGFSRFLPTGRGLFAFDTEDEAATALAEVDRDYAAQSRAAHEVAREHFDSNRVLGALCREAGL
jgi:hypothetical protein